MSHGKIANKEQISDFSGMSDLKKDNILLPTKNLSHDETEKYINKTYERIAKQISKANHQGTINYDEYIKRLNDLDKELHDAHDRNGSLIKPNVITELLEMENACHMIEDEVVEYKEKMKAIKKSNQEDILLEKNLKQHPDYVHINKQRKISFVSEDLPFIQRNSDNHEVDKSKNQVIQYKNQEQQTGRA